MKYFDKSPAVILLEDGTSFTGFSAGKIGTSSGEICFNTGMTGYQEIFTDPSYFGQVMVMTNAHIGNYGTTAKENESNRVQINGLITKNLTNLFSRFLADNEIQEYLLQNQIVAITGVDTRALVKHIRDKGAMNAIISSEILDLNALKTKLQNTPSMKGLELASQVSTKTTYFMGSENDALKVVVLDFGVKKSILENLVARGCYLKVFPATTSFSEILDWNPVGFFASNGPGDPETMSYAVDTIKQVMENRIPFFGICLGHQIFARALGVRTYKMHNGHRGINHPVKNILTGKSEITSQNHGFTINEEDVNQHSDLQITHVNLNDNTIEGLRHKSLKAFSVQYHPEASPGPHDSRYLFDNFVQLMSNN